MRDILLTALTQSHAALETLLRDDAAIEGFETWATLLAEAFSARRKALVCGNGGSMADAMHFAEECSGRFLRERRPYPALALSDPAHLSCVANDYGYDAVFARQVEALGQPGDLLILLTTSGNSPNLLRAAESAQKQGVVTLGLLGRGGGPLRALCDHAILVPGERSDRIQEVQMLILHALVEAVELRLELPHA